MVPGSWFLVHGAGSWFKTWNHEPGTRTRNHEPGTMNHEPLTMNRPFPSRPVPAQEHDFAKPEPPKSGPRDPSAWAVAAIHDKLFTTLRRDLAGSRSNLGEGNIYRFRNVTRGVLGGRSDIKHHRSICFSDAASEVGQIGR